MPRGARAATERTSRSVVGVDELRESLVPPSRRDVCSPPIAQATDLGVGVGILRAQQRVCIGIVIEAPPPGHAQTAAVTISLDRDELVAPGQKEKTCFHSPALPTPLWRNTTGVPVPCSMILTRRLSGVRSVVIAAIRRRPRPQSPSLTTGSSATGSRSAGLGSRATLRPGAGTRGYG